MLSLFPNLWSYLIAGVAAVLTLLGYGARQRTKGRKGAEIDTLKDSVKREKRGRDAVVKEQSDAEGLSNSDIVERMRRRDGDFTGL